MVIWDIDLIIMHFNMEYKKKFFLLIVLFRKNCQFKPADGIGIIHWAWGSVCVEIWGFGWCCSPPFIDLWILSGEKSFHFPKLGRALPQTKPENSPSTGHWNSKSQGLQVFFPLYVHD